MIDPIDPRGDLGYLAVGLEYLRQAQEPALEQLGHDNIDPDTLARYAAALMIEVAEFANTVPWKVWHLADEEPTAEETRAAVAEEFGDVLHFIGTWVALLQRLGIGVEELSEAFLVKHLRNRRKMLVEQEVTR